MSSHLLPTSAHSGYGLWTSYFAVCVQYTPVTTANRDHLHPLTSGFCVPAASAGNFGDSLLSETQNLSVSVGAAFENRSVRESGQSHDIITGLLTLFTNLCVCDVN